MLAARRPPRRVRPGNSAASLDDLICSGEERRRDREAEIACCLEIDHQFDCWKLNRQVARSFSSQDFTNVGSATSVAVSEVDGIAYETPGLHEFAPAEKAGQAILGGERQDTLVLTDEDW